MVEDIRHGRDRRIFRSNMAIANRAEQVMKVQRRELGLPEEPKPLKIGKVTELKFKK